MFNSKLLTTLLITASAVSMSANADMFSPSHSCTKPYKPYEFKDQWEVDSFNDDVNRYKSCISDFVEEQNNEAQRHAEAAEEAIDEWNQYVRYELNN